MKKNKDEAKLYGSRWNMVHSGYFADPDISRPFVKAIARTMKAQQAALF